MRPLTVNSRAARKPRDNPMDSEITQKDGSPSCAVIGSALQIEQPHSINGRRWFFRRGIAGGFGAEYGVTLDKRTVERRLAAKAGRGSLVEIKGAWHWMPNEKLTP